MDIILFVLRTLFLVLIYVFIFILLVYLIRDLHNTDGPAASDIAGAQTGDGPAGRGVRKKSGFGVLVVESAPREYALEGSEYELTREIKLGRGPVNEIILPGRFVSNRHARLYMRDGQYWLEDLGSKNGTYLNGKLVTGPAVLADGDQIRIGDIIFRFVRWGYEVESDHRMRSGAPAE